MIVNNQYFIAVNERFPHIGKRLELIWGSKECAVYLNHLLSDTRNNTRQGFPPPIGAYILRLLEMHSHTFKCVEDSKDIWHQGYKL